MCLERPSWTVVQRDGGEYLSASSVIGVKSER